MVDVVLEDQRLFDFINGVPQYDVQESQYADTRSVSRGALSPNEDLFGTSGWSGDCKVWGIPDCLLKTTLKGHRDRVVSIRFHPTSTKSMDSKALCNMATSSADKSVRLWSLDPEQQFQKSVEIKGHEDTVNFVEFHPMGKHIISSSHDHTWRLWDIQT
mmetsp:Transcript_5507/g.9356  ORF Transcript_5507/g.9356 Transcript_5507/m.9356 type:complete len:159 (+) Transcript_5507:676-1152(+)